MDKLPEDVEDTVPAVVPKRNLYIVIAFSALLLFLVVPVLLYRYGIHSSSLSQNKEFVIDEGNGVSVVAHELASQGIIQSEFLFKLYLKINKLDTNIQAGSYLIPAGSSIVDLGKILQHGRNDATITYIEGWRVEQLGLLLIDALDNFDYVKFVDLAKPYEGYLFPDTYVFNKNAGEEKVFEVLRDTFDKKTQTFLNEGKLSDIGLTKEQAAIFASIVEREALHDEDRKIIAGILIKRFKEGMKIEADATTQYAVALRRHCASEFASDPANLQKCETGRYPELLEDIDWWPNGLTLEELSLEDPYNTRAEAVLPPAPISSFSISSLDAVINYEPTQYYFYLTGNDGNTYFGRTLEEHNANIANHLR